MQRIAILCFLLACNACASVPPAVEVTPLADEEPANPLETFTYNQVIEYFQPCIFKHEPPKFLNDWRSVCMDI